MKETSKTIKLSDIRRILSSRLIELNSNPNGDKLMLEMLKAVFALPELSVQKVGNISKDQVVQLCLGRIDELKHKSDIVDKMILHIERVRYNTITKFLNDQKDGKGFSGYDFVESVEHSYISFLDVYRVEFETICNTIRDSMDLMTGYGMSCIVKEWYDTLKGSLKTVQEPLKTKIEMALILPIYEEKKYSSLLSYKAELEAQERVAKKVLEWIESEIKAISIDMGYLDHSDFARKYDSHESVLEYFANKLKKYRAWSKTMEKDIYNYQHAIDQINFLITD